MRVPLTHPVLPLKRGGRAERLVKEAGHTIAECGTCRRQWDDSEPTSMTPAPAGRCPFEYYH